MAGPHRDDAGNVVIESDRAAMRRYLADLHGRDGVEGALARIGAMLLALVTYAAALMGPAEARDFLGRHLEKALDSMDRAYGTGEPRQ